MEFAINQTPFKLEDAAAKLFNSPFLSDITFIIGDKQIYAHSLILMMRSSVFQEQLESTLSEKKIIPIVYHEYEVFYELIRYIYTDQYSISEKNHFQLLKLAKKYNVIRLVNELINMDNISLLEILNFCIEENFQVALNNTKLLLSFQLNYYLRRYQLLLMHPNAIAEILKLDDITEPVTEIEIIEALVSWMNNYCMQNGIQFRKCCQKFKNLIRLIRFPTLSNGELRDIRRKYPGLLTKARLQTISAQKLYGVDYGDRIWNCTPRKQFILPYDWKEFSCDDDFETKFTVSSEMILGGLVFGKQLFATTSSCDITISYELPKTHIKAQINIEEVKTLNHCTVICLGASIRVKPNLTYTVGYKIKNQKDKKVTYLFRKPQTDLIINAPQSSIKVISAHPTMIELFFIKPKND